MPEAKTKTFRWLFPLSPPTSPAPLAHPSPRLEALPDLSYCFKPKFTVSVGGQDPLSPPQPRGPWDSVEAGGPAHLPSALAQPGGRSMGRGEETAALSSPCRVLIPLGHGHGEPSSQPWAASWGLSRPPSPGPSSPSHWECGFQRRSWKKSETLHRPPMGDPNLRPRTGCV